MLRLSGAYTFQPAKGCLISESRHACCASGLTFRLCTSTVWPRFATLSGRYRRGPCKKSAKRSLSGKQDREHGCHFHLGLRWCCGVSRCVVRRRIFVTGYSRSGDKTGGRGHGNTVIPPRFLAGEAHAHGANVARRKIGAEAVCQGCHVTMERNP